MMKFPFVLKMKGTFRRDNDDDTFVVRVMKWLLLSDSVYIVTRVCGKVDF